MKYFIQTFGCQMNEADSEKLAGFFVSQGHKIVSKAELADVVVINTCSVRQSAEDRVLGLVNNLKKYKLQATSYKPKIIVTGCMLRYTIYQLRRMLPDVDEFIQIKDLIGNCKLKIKNSKASAFVVIMQGCDNFCTYCVVPYARGREKSRPMEEIVCEVEELVKRGYEEVTLLGQNVNSYKPNFAQLLKKLHPIAGLKKIKFLTSNPHDLSDEIIEAMKLAKIDRYLHLALQSGDDAILKKMNRKYTAAQYLALVKKIRQAIPGIEIGTDIIVGFPGETKKQFQNTVNLCKKIGFSVAYVNKYSPREGTAAFKLKDSVPVAEKKRRWKILDKLINQK